MIIACVIAILAVLIVGYYYCYKRPDNFPPGPPIIPVLGSLPFIGIGQHPIYITYTNLAKKYGGVFSVAIGHRMSVVLTGHDVIREAVVGQSTDFAGRPELDYRTRYFNPRQVGLGLCAYTEEWKKQKSVSLAILRSLSQSGLSTEQRIHTECEALVRNFVSQDGRPFNPNVPLSMAVCNVICHLTFGKRYEFDNSEFLSLMKDLDEFLFNIMRDADGDFVPLMRLRPGHRKTMKHFRQICSNMISFLQARIQESKHEYQPDAAPQDFVQAYVTELESSNTGNDSDVARTGVLVGDDWLLEIVTDMFVGGADTSTTTLTWALLYAIRYPPVQDKLHEEIDKVLSGRRACTSDRSALTYTEAYIMETLRYSSMGGLTFRATTRDCKFRGYCIPKGTDVVINDWQVNRDPALWDQPHQFKPERFIRNGKLHRPDYYIAFGHGKRSCFGEQLAKQELFLFLVTMVQNFQFLPAKQNELPTEEPIGDELILKAQKFELVAKLRQK